MNQDYIGKKINDWTILSFSGKDKFGQDTYLCVCKCGKKKNKNIYEILRGHSISCRSCSAKKRKTTYSDIRNEKEYKRLKNIFSHMKQRCYNKNNPKYKTYGGNGIYICEEWMDSKTGFRSFFDWSLKKGYKQNLTIDRIDYTREYSPSNCRWATQSEQQNNKSSNIWITYKGTRMTLMQFSKKYNIPYETLSQRINKYGITDPQKLVKRKLKIRRNHKYFATINGKTLSIQEWCEKFGLNKQSIYSRVKKYGYSSENAILKPIKKTNRIY